MDLLILVALLAGPYAAVRLFTLRFNRGDAGALGAALLFLTTGLGHFALTKEMTGMLPEWVPVKTFVVLATGILEFALAAGILDRKTRVSTGWMALVFLVAAFTANIHASLNYSSMGGGSWGPLYLLVRAPVQLVFLIWIYLFCVKPAPLASSQLA